MYHVSKIALVVLEKGRTLSEEEKRIFYRKGYYIEKIEYYVLDGIKLTDKERIRSANIIFICYKNKISGFSQKIIKYAAIFDKKIVINNKVEPTDF